MNLTDVCLLQKELKGVVCPVKLYHSITVWNWACFTRKRIDKGEGDLGIRSQNSGRRKLHKFLHFFKAPGADYPGRNQNQATGPAPGGQDFFILEGLQKSAPVLSSGVSVRQGNVGRDG